MDEFLLGKSRYNIDYYLVLLQMFILCMETCFSACSGAGGTRIPHPGSLSLWDVVPSKVGSNCVSPRLREALSPRRSDISHLPPQLAPSCLPIRNEIRARQSQLRQARPRPVLPSDAEHLSC